MSKLADMILELCPNGVEYKKLGDIGAICMCKRILKSQTNSAEGVPFYKIGTFGGKANAYISWDVFREYKEKYPYPRKGEVLLSAAGTIGRRVIFDGEPAYFQDSNIVWISNNEEVVLNKYLYYYYELQPWNIANGGTIARLYNDSIANTLIPIPPMEVQREIIRVMDELSVLTAKIVEELSTELKTREIQYHYYRRVLLGFDGDVPQMKLGEIGKVCMCKRILKSQTNTQGGIPFFKIGTFGKQADAFISEELFNEYKSKYNYPKKGDILISAAGTIGRTVIFDGEPAYFQDSNIVWLDNDESKVLNRFLKLCYAMNPWKVSEGGTIARLYNDNISNAVIPVPSLQQQKHIIDKLECLDSLWNSISEELLKEIEARKKQYEYYRNKLMNLKEAL